MACLARGGKCGLRAASGPRLASAASRSASAAMPNPEPMVRSTSLRLHFMVLPSVDEEELVGAEQDLRVLLPGVVAATQVVEAEPRFLPGRVSPENHAVGLLDFSLVVPSRQPRGEPARGERHESAVHQEQA